MEVGTRVVRGPDWSAGDLDGGEGHVGTVVSVERETTCDVLWDNGRQSTCRTGSGGKYDLRVFDSAPAGVQHKGTCCSACRVPDVGGTLWVCNTCNTCKLCTICYGVLEHDITHKFKRFDTPSCKGCLVSPRCSSLRMQAVGMFPGAVVSKGGDWCGGKVVAIEDHPSGATMRSMVRVSRGEGQSDLLRAGHLGTVDVQCMTEYPGTFYYRDHLALFKRDFSDVARTIKETRRLFTGGDRVCLRVSLHNLREMQGQAGLSEHRIDQDKPKFGTVKSYTPEGHVNVSFGGHMMVVPQGVLKKMLLLTEGDNVRICSDLEELKQLQEGHGGFTADMAETLGKVGVVDDVTSDGDVDVKFVSLRCRYNPACCTAASGQSVDVLFAKSDDSVVTEVVHGMKQEGVEEDADLDGEMVTDAALLGKVAAMSDAFMKGNYSLCLEFIVNDTRLKNIRFLGKPLLIHACMNDRHEFVQQLLDVGVDINRRDSDRSTAILVATVRNDRELARVLVKGGCDVNLQGALEATPLHMCAMTKNGEMAEILLQRPADLRLKDVNGNTAVHCALESQQNHIIKLMFASSSSHIDPAIVNGKQFNILHYATMTENYRAVEMILTKFPEAVDTPMPQNNFTALHMAANNNLTDCARVLIDKGKANINARNIHGVTPLHLACVNLYDSTVSFLLKKGVDVNAQEENHGNTALHFTLDVSVTRQGLMGLVGLQEDNTESRIQLACKLLKSGARPDNRNKAGQTALDTVRNETVRTAVTMFIRSQSGPTASPSTEPNGDSKLNQMCFHCLTSRVDTRTQPCGHRFLCRKCVGVVKLCPFCKQQIDGSEDMDNGNDSHEVKKNRETARLFTIGERVCLRMSPVRLREMQRQAGLSEHGINQEMSRKGIVKNYTLAGHVTVSFDGSEVIVKEEALQKMVLTEGDTVRICSDLEELKQLQDRHGGFVPDMARTLGKVGVVKKVEHNGDLVVLFGMTRYQYNPAVCTPAPGESVDVINARNPFSGLGNPLHGMGNPLHGMGNPLHGMGNPFSGLGDDSHGIGGLLRGLGNPFQTGFSVGTATMEVSVGNDNGETTVGGETVTDAALLEKAEGMFDAFGKGNYSLCLVILRLDGRLKSIVHRGKTLLNLACLNGRHEFARQLLDEGVDINLGDCTNTAPIAVAVAKKDTEMASLLVERGCDVNARVVMDLTPLHMCIPADNRDLARVLLKGKADVNAQYFLGVTPLHVAIDLGRDEMLELLLAESTGLDPTIKDERGFTILHSSAIKGRVKCLKSILARFPGVVDATMPEHAFTALHIAANNCHTDCVTTLLQMGQAQVNARSTQGWTALHLACRKLCEGTITVLLQKGAEVNSQDGEGNTPLHFLLRGQVSVPATLVLGSPAEQLGNDEARIQLACKLLKSSARPHIRNNAGQTALETVQNEKVRTAVTMFIRSQEGSTEWEPSSESAMTMICAHCLACHVDIRLRPCGHRFLCRTCVGLVKLCPFCKQQIDGSEDLGEVNEADDSVTKQSCKVQ